MFISCVPAVASGKAERALTGDSCVIIMEIPKGVSFFCAFLVKGVVL